MNKRTETGAAQATADSEQRITAEALKSAIMRISDGIAAWDKAGVKRRVLVLLLADSSGLKRMDVDKVLKSMDQIKEEFLK